MNLSGKLSAPDSLEQLGESRIVGHAQALPGKIQRARLIDGPREAAAVRAPREVERKDRCTEECRERRTKHDFPRSPPRPDIFPSSHQSSLSEVIAVPGTQP